ncbi:MAG: HigA family addiction module antitoxin [Bryobacteraceae bacterium]
MLAKLPPIHPGRMLKGELKAAGISAHQASLAMRIPANRLTMILNGKRSITAETALRLARFFGTTAELWMSLQLQFDLDVAEDAYAEAVANEVQPLAKAS